jgi:hypothetical protein
MQNCLKLRLVVDNTRSAEGYDTITGHDEVTLWLAEGLGVVAQSGTWSEQQGEAPSETWTFEQMLANPQLMGAPTVDLAVNAGRVSLPATLVPGQRVRVPLLLANLGNEPYVGNVNVQLFASADGNLDLGDRALAGRNEVSVRLAPGRQKMVSLVLTVPDDLDAGGYTFFAALDSQGADEADFFNNSAPLGSADVAWQLGRLPAGGFVRSLTMRDAIGQPVTMSLAGPGWGQVTRDVEGNLQVALNETDLRTTLRLATPRGQEAAVGRITGCEDIGAIVGPAVDLQGLIDFGGAVGRIVLDDVTGGSSIVIGDDSATGRPAVMKFDRLADVSIKSDAPIAALVAREWVSNESGLTDVLEAASVGRLLITGDARRGLAGDLAADLQTPGGVGIASVAGDLLGASWDIDGDIRSLLVGGAARGATVHTTGSTNRLVLGQAVDSDFLAGTWTSSGRADSGYDFTGSGGFGVIRVWGLRGRSGPDVVNSNFSGGFVGSAVLSGVETYNEGQSFGLWLPQDAAIGGMLVNDYSSGLWYRWPGGSLFGSSADFGVSFLPEIGE